MLRIRRKLSHRPEGLSSRQSCVCGGRITIDNEAIKFSALVRALRLHQWAKNLLVFVPLVTSHNVANLPLLLNAILAFLAFSLSASGAYVINDLLDLSADRQHPDKKHRPFASGEISPILGLGLVPFLLGAGIGIGYILPPVFTGVLILYVLLAIAYSLYFKKFLLLDVVLLAGLYTIRIYGGALAIGVTTSQWLLTFSLFVFLSLALMKRFSELRAVEGASRKPAEGRGYVAEDLNYIGTIGAATSSISVLVLALYINSEEVRILYQRPELLWLTCPLMFYWISRAWLVAHRGHMHEDPIVFALRDSQSYATGIIMAILLWIAA